MYLLFVYKASDADFRSFRDSPYISVIGNDMIKVEQVVNFVSIFLWCNNFPSISVLALVQDLAVNINNKTSRTFVVFVFMSLDASNKNQRFKTHC